MFDDPLLRSFSPTLSTEKRKYDLDSQPPVAVGCGVGPAAAPAHTGPRAFSCGCEGVPSAVALVGLDAQLDLALVVGEPGCARGVGGRRGVRS